MTGAPPDNQDSSAGAAASTRDDFSGTHTPTRSSATEEAFAADLLDNRAANGASQFPSLALLRPSSSDGREAIQSGAIRVVESATESWVPGPAYVPSPDDVFDPFGWTRSVEDKLRREIEEWFTDRPPAWLAEVTSRTPYTQQGEHAASPANTRQESAWSSTQEAWQRMHEQLSTEHARGVEDGVLLRGWHPLRAEVGTVFDAVAAEAIGSPARIGVGGFNPPRFEGLSEGFAVIA
ncbi:MAG: hypothetical protein HYY79_03800 [Betaproteobacteria bacterium]|nr:hypothetical protein [Betaproteobacteria bacterium]